MRTKILLGLAALTLGAAFGFTTVQADSGPTCTQQCFQQYRACIAATPDKEPLCWAFRQQCMQDCGAFN